MTILRIGTGARPQAIGGHDLEPDDRASAHWRSLVLSLDSAPCPARGWPRRDLDCLPRTGHREGRRSGRGGKRLLMMRNLVNGAVGGALATAVYSAMLMAADRAGLLEEPPPRRFARLNLPGRDKPRRGENVLGTIAH